MDDLEILLLGLIWSSVRPHKAPRPASVRLERATVGLALQIAGAFSPGVKGWRWLS